MSTFTTVPKNRLSWAATPIEVVGGDEYDLLISDEYKLDIGGYYLTIQSATAETVYETVAKSQSGHSWPSPVTVVDDYFLEIADGFKLLIDNQHYLIVDPARGETIWTEIKKRH